MPTPDPIFRRRSAFTLIELLTVIAIVGILAAILIPALASVRRSASKATMTSNLRQIGISVGLFSTDNGGRMPGMYAAGPDANGLNDSFALTTGQSAYATYSGTGTEPRANIQSIDQLGRYVTRSTVIVDGISKLYCPLLESPAFASQRPAGVFPTSIELGITVMSNDGSLVYPFGKKGGTPSMRFRQIGSFFNPSRHWMAIEIDKTTPTTVDPTLSSASWYGALPDQPVHNGGWLTLMYDGSVTSLKAGDPLLNNKAAAY